MSVLRYQQYQAPTSCSSTTDSLPGGTSVNSPTIYQGFAMNPPTVPSPPQRVAQCDARHTPQRTVTHFHPYARPGAQPAPNQTRSAFFISNTSFPRGKIFTTTHSPTHTPPFPVVRRPAFRAVTQHSLTILSPCILYVAYACSQKCRSMGICVHYQFVLGASRCPDGLICARCKEAKAAAIERGGEGEKVEQAISSLQARRCPLHQARNSVNPVENRPEDFLATDEQKIRCDEILERSVNNIWGDGKMENVTPIPREGRAHLPTTGEAPIGMNGKEALRNQPYCPYGPAGLGFTPADCRLAGFDMGRLTSGMVTPQLEQEDLFFGQYGGVFAGNPLSSESTLGEGLSSLSRTTTTDSMLWSDESV